MHALRLETDERGDHLLRLIGKGHQAGKVGPAAARVGALTRHLVEHGLPVTPARWQPDTPLIATLEEGATGIKLILDGEDVFVSSASIWEASIKAGLGKLDADVDMLAAEIEVSGFLELPVRAVHAAMVRTLRDIHRDPLCRRSDSDRQFDIT